MIVRQVSVFLENKTGRLNEVAKILGEAGVNISAFSIADTSDFGVLRMIVPDPGKAVEVLRASYFSVQTTPVVLVTSPNQPGSLARLLSILSTENIFIEYIYAFSMNEDSAVIVIRPSDIEGCVGVLDRYREELGVGPGGFQV
ncbi:MAG: ACT domain-containing protein [Bacteroidota bacterium]